MEFRIDDIDQIISSLTEEEASTAIEVKSVYATPTAAAVTTTTTTTVNNDLSDRQYCLIIFNNPRWSKILQQKKAAKTAQEVNVKVCINVCAFI